MSVETPITSPESTGTAAEAGAGATARFRANKTIGAASSQERVARLAGRVIKAVNDAVLEEEVTYDEYNALKAWLIKVGEDGEWPLFLDVWVEHSVEEVANANRHGSKGTIEGPYYVRTRPHRRPPPTCPCGRTSPGRRCSSRARSRTSTANRSRTPKSRSGTRTT
jgi:catechol 1,2-dioxygenase